MNSYININMSLIKGDRLSYFNLLSYPNFKGYASVKTFVKPLVFTKASFNHELPDNYDPLALKSTNSIINKKTPPILTSSFFSNNNNMSLVNQRQPDLHLSVKNIHRLKDMKKNLLELNLNKSLLVENSSIGIKLKKYYTSYSKLSEVKLLTIGIASPLRILQWAEKTLPNGKIYGEVLNANTLHHKTFKPQKGGLFCERIFGPLKDFECACGKTDKLIKKQQNELKLLALPSKEESNSSENQLFTNTSTNTNIGVEQNIKINRKYCPECDVEYTWSVIRRYQLGYIKLSSPITHIWFLKGTPSYLSLLLDMKKRYLQFVTYCSETLTIEKSVVPFYLNKESYLENLIDKKDRYKTSKEKQKVKCFPKKGYLSEVTKSKSQNALNTKKSSFQGKENRNKMYNQPGKNIKGNLLFASIILSIFYKNPLKFILAKFKQRHENNLNLLIQEIPNFKKLIKKLPLDLYILCSLEWMLHKTSIHLSIQKTWEIIYKKSFFKAAYKSQNILKRFLGFNNLSTYKDLNSQSQSQSQTIDLYNKFIFKNLSFLQTKAKIVNKNQITLNNLKKQYNDHVLKSLEKLRYPILSVNHTTLFLEKNSFSKINQSIATDISHYLLNNMEYFEKSLTKQFINLFLLDKFLTIYILNENSNKRTAFVFKNEEVKLNAKNNELQSNIKIEKTISILNNLRRFFVLKNKSFDDFSIEFKQRKKIENVNKIKSFIDLDQSKKKNNYNNIYTLSHRERWDADKDWYIFSLFSFGITEYIDYPISNYKKRLVSLTHLQEYSFNYNNEAFFKHEKETSKNEKGIVKPSVKRSNTTLLDNITQNSGTVSASFIYSNSFYSGAGIVQQLLNEFDFNEIQKLDKQNRLLLYQLNKSILKLKKIAQIFVYDKTAQVKLKELCKKRDLLIRRTKLVRKMFRKNTSPASMVLTVIPVLPPDLRPIVKMGNQIAASDLNRLYQRVIYRNDRLKKFLKDPATSQSYEMKYAQRLLQEAVDNLMQNGKSGPNSEKDARGRALKSLSDILKGKQGRFRQFLLGKRVDYSGRSVIVVGPKLKLHECGLPLEMAKELYLPFLLKSILNKNYAKTVVGAKTLIQNNPSLANELLHEIMQTTPVLLNRAPTLHRLGIQAFVPKLIQGRAILLHPLVCSAFNADFDGDQMAVHVPITIEARAEAWKMMLSRNNLLAPATGDPLAIPSQDMVLGCYYLTTFLNPKKSNFLRGSGMYFNHLYDVIKFCPEGEQQFIDIHSLVWVKWNKWKPFRSLGGYRRYQPNTKIDTDTIVNAGMDFIQNGNDDEIPIEIRVWPSGQWQEISLNYQKTYSPTHDLINLYMCTTPGRILFNLILQQAFAY